MHFGKDVRFFQYEVESKITKNRVHLDVKAGGPPPDAERRARIEAGREPADGCWWVHLPAG